jgi:hypothetical protein
MYSLISKENDENCVVDNMYTVFWFNKQNEFETIYVRERLDVWLCFFA